LLFWLNTKRKPLGNFYERKEEEGNVFYKIARFYTLNELKFMLKNVEVMSTILGSPTKEPLHFEFPKEGYYKEAGFVVLKTRKDDYVAQGKM
jgi:hypothetical protein